MTRRRWIGPVGVSVSFTLVMFGLFELADRHVRGWYDVGLGALFLVPYFVVTSRMNDDEDEDSQAVRPDRRMWVQVVGFILVTTAVGIFAIWDGASSSPANVVYIVIGVAILVGVLVVVSATVNKQWRIRH